ncbi:MAG TPA: uroporphyrinogen-III synthase [Sphingomonas sp.]
MIRPLLVLRPEPGAAATRAAARARGLEAVAAPLFATRPIDWTLPDPLPAAVLMTSANAAHLGGAGLAALTGLPLYAVGPATARAARAAGFTDIVGGAGGIDAILARAAMDAVTPLLHLAGREHHLPAAPPLPIVRRIVYAADAADRLPAGARAVLPGAIVLLHSARAAATFARLLDAAGIARGAVAIAAISPAARAAAGDGWRATIVADQPDDAALLAAAAKLCDQGG